MPKKPARIKVFKFQSPYKGKKTAFPETANRKGVYLIKENGKLVYIGYSAKNLYRTLYRHFQVWNEKYNKWTKREPGNHVTYFNQLARNNYTVRIIFTNTEAQAERLERALIIKHQPRDNAQKYDSYQLTMFDKQLVEEYQETDVIMDCPF